jgi:hypothetical protein
LDRLKRSRMNGGFRVRVRMTLRVRVRIRIRGENK